MDVGRSLEQAVKLHTEGRVAEAAQIYEEVLAVHPNHADALHLSGVIALQSRRIEEAHQRISRAIAINPGVAEYYNNLGNVLVKQDRLEEAVMAFQRAVMLRPNYPKAFSNLGNAMKKLGRFETAMRAYGEAAALDPKYVEAKWNLGLLQLLLGNLEQGWAGFEHRLEVGEIRRGKRQCTQPRWNGECLNGQRILLHVEQGFGDTIQFVRFAPMVAQRGGRVILEIQPELIRIIEGLNGIEHVVARGNPIPEFDLHCPLMSLPCVFRTTIRTIADSVPYLSVPHDIVQRWNQKITPSGSQARVGLAWAGNPTHPNDRNRSVPLRALAPLFEITGFDFYSLQVSAPGAQTGSSMFPALKDLSGEFRDFADTAALIQSLDLVVTVDTAVAHLAGALGKPVWLLLPFVPDWRWLLSREDSPWYPTMKLFRQRCAGEWGEVIDRVAAELRNFCK
jgi:TPR repeat/Glycosyltransferase family 9 (heptosyltransferase)/Tetratricopeptide repeat